MDQHSYYELQILNQLEETPYLTNRMASSKLGVSIKLAHSLFKGLVRRGLVHARKRDGRSLYHFLTPNGVSEKIRLTYEFMQFSTQFYREARKRSSEVCRDLASAGVRKVAFLGCGELAEISFLGVKEHGLQLVDVFDVERAGDVFLGQIVKGVDDDALRAEKKRFGKMLVTTYNPALPTLGHYVPEGITPDERFVWIFDGRAMVNEAVERLPRLPEPDGKDAAV